MLLIAFYGKMWHTITMEISIQREPTDDIRLYVACTTENRDLADAVQKLFNETLGGFEFCNPTEIHGRWTTRTPCQLHLKGDADATAGDRGNTVVDAFARVLNIFSHMKARAVVARPAANVNEAAALAETMGTQSPQLYGLPALLKKLDACDDLGVERVAAAVICTGEDDDLSELPDEYTSRLVEGAYLPIYPAMNADLRNLPDGTKLGEAPSWQWSYLLAGAALGLTLITLPRLHRRLFRTA